MEKIILFYKFVPIADPEMTVRWQKELCSRLGLSGRTIVSEHGINGTLGGPLEGLVEYKREMNSSGIFRGIDYKWSAGGREDFPRLSIKARTELVTFGMPDGFEVDEQGVVGGGKHLSPTALNSLVEQRGDEVVFFDGRNAYEAQIGRFRGAIVPNVDTSHDFLAALDDESLAEYKDRPIVTYCTGGIRCEVLSAVLRDKGFSEVYQVKGGIIKYVSEFGEDGLWEGSLYTFDKRMIVDFGSDTSTLGRCDECNGSEKIFRNCAVLDCKARFLRCEGCLASQSQCSQHQMADA
ncbi:MAG: rhodanese-related sulfurtransferase [Acidimicrobiales bacterium]